MRLPSPLAVAVALVVALAGAACRSDERAAPGEVALAGETVTEARLRSIPAGICDAAEQAGRDIASARAIFFGQSHEGLHLIARGLGDLDRAAAADLLEAKQKVEAALADPTPGAELVAHLRHLADVTRSALARFNVTVDPCPPA